MVACELHMFLTHLFVSISRADHIEDMSGFEYFTYILFVFQSGLRMEVKSVASVAYDWLGWACKSSKVGCLLGCQGLVLERQTLPRFRLFLCLAPTNIHYQTLSYTAYHTHPIVTPQHSLSTYRLRSLPSAALTTFLKCLQTARDRHEQLPSRSQKASPSPRESHSAREDCAIWRSPTTNWRAETGSACESLRFDAECFQQTTQEHRTKSSRAFTRDQTKECHTTACRTTIQRRR
jgi:hypothetical protein